MILKLVLFFLLISFNQTKALADRNGLRVVPSYLKYLINHCRRVPTILSFNKNGDYHGLDPKKDFEPYQNEINRLTEKILEDEIYFHTRNYLIGARDVIYDAKIISEVVKDISVPYFKEIFLMAQQLHKILVGEEQNLRVIAEYEWYNKKAFQIRDELRADSGWQAQANSSNLFERKAAFEVLFNRYIRLRMEAKHYPDLVMPIDFKVAEVDVPKPGDFYEYKRGEGFYGFMLAVFYSTATKYQALPWDRRWPIGEKINDQLVHAQNRLNSILAALGLEYGNNHRFNPYPTSSWEYIYYVRRGPSDNR